MPGTSLDGGALAAVLRASQTLDLARFVEICVEEIGRLAAADAVHAYLQSEPSSDLELSASWTGGARAPRRAPAVLDGRLLAEAVPGEVVQPSFLRPRGAPWAADPPAGLRLFPIGQGKERLGLFLVAHTAPSAPTARHGGGDLQAFFAALDPAVENIVTVRALREASLRDDIAQCYNRRYFDTFLREEIARASRFRSSVSILFLDMDRLKEVNSAHGHSMGSRSLFEVSIRITSSIRKIDKLFRFGGDEFCIVLPETDPRGAFEVGSRIRRTIAEAPFLVEQVGGVPLTASLGLATYPENGRSAEALVQAADRAMQIVKGAGKNAVGVAESELAGAAPGRRRPSVPKDEA